MISRHRGIAERRAKDDEPSKCAENEAAHLVQSISDLLELLWGKFPRIYAFDLTPKGGKLGGISSSW